MAIAVPAAANASGDVTRDGAHVRRVAHRHTIPVAAVALSPSMVAPAVRPDDDSDGLTRNTDECNRGCIDN